MSVMFRRVSISLALCIAIFALYVGRLSTKDGQSGAVLGSGEFFDGVAPRYDLLNRVISFGFDRAWRRAAVRALSPAQKVLDVGTGTADLVRALIAEQTDTPLEITGIDPSTKMLQIAREKFRAVLESPSERYTVKFLKAKAEYLPFENNSFDAVVAAFGVRNFQDRAKGISEMVRVVKFGGRVVILELSLANGDSIVHKARALFVTRIMPTVASVLASNPYAYGYLRDSMRAFPSGAEFTAMLRNAGLSSVRHSALPPFGAGPDLYVCIK